MSETHEDCRTGHREAKSSELAFRLRTRPVGMHREPDREPAPMGNCVRCGSTIVFETEES